MAEREQPTNARDELREIERRLEEVRTALSGSSFLGRIPRTAYWQVRDAWAMVSGVLVDHEDELATVQIGQCGEGGMTERLYQYVERFFQRSGCTEWPTVRRCARSLGLPQSEIVQQIEDDERLDRTYYHVGYVVPDGDWYVESYGEPVVEEQRPSLESIPP